MQSTGVFAHDDNRGEGVGENLYYAKSGSGERELAIQTTDVATRSWYEKEEFMFTYAGEYVSGTGHFTQVVWAATCDVGCGRSENYVVCRYYAAGNNLSTFAENVFEPTPP